MSVGWGGTQKGMHITKEYKCVVNEWVRNKIQPK